MLASSAMHTFTTTSCSQSGHREVTLQLVHTLPVPNLERILLDYFETAVKRGAKYVPDQIIRFGWSVLRVCERSDGTLGVEERKLTPQLDWTESVDHALMDLFTQQQIAVSIGLVNEMSYPTQDEAVLVTQCAVEATALSFIRLDAELPNGYSGWSLTCSEDHDHGQAEALPLLALAANQPGLVQLLPLPPGCSVAIKFVDKEGAPKGGRIEPHVFRNGVELPVEPGSYLAALQGP